MALITIRTIAFLAYTFVYYNFFFFYRVLSIWTAINIQPSSSSSNRIDGGDSPTPMVPFRWARLDYKTGGRDRSDHHTRPDHRSTRTHPVRRNNAASRNNMAGRLSCLLASAALLAAVALASPTKADQQVHTRMVNSYEISERNERKDDGLYRCTATRGRPRFRRGSRRKNFKPLFG